MSDIDYQLIADNINFFTGYSCTSDDVRAMITSITREPVAPIEFKEILSLRNLEMATVKYLGTMKKQPDRVYRINPNMPSVEILQKAVTDAGYGIVHHRALLRKEKPI